jgi:hypothetical protein
MPDFDIYAKINGRTQRAETVQAKNGTQAKKKVRHKYSGTLYAVSHRPTDAWYAISTSQVNDATALNPSAMYFRTVQAPGPTIAKVMAQEQYGTSRVRTNLSNQSLRLQFKTENFWYDAGPHIFEENRTWGTKLLRTSGVYVPAKFVRAR